jgi:hypothetical protein
MLLDLTVRAHPPAGDNLAVVVEIRISRISVTVSAAPTMATFLYFIIPPANASGRSFNRRLVEHLPKQQRREVTNDFPPLLAHRI